MKFLIVSDSHGRHSNLKSVIETVGRIDGMFHLGDIEGGLDDILELIDYPFWGVKGNNDFGSILDSEKIVSIGGHKIFMTHGHRYPLLWSTKALADAGKERGCDIVMFGHTHVPYLQETDGVWLVNPGSISQPRQSPRVPTYLLMEIDEQQRLHFSQAQMIEK